MPLVVIQRFIRTSFDEICTISQVKHIVQIAVKRGKKMEVSFSLHIKGALINMSYISISLYFSVVLVKQEDNTECQMVKQPQFREITVHLHELR